MRRTPKEIIAEWGKQVLEAKNITANEMAVQAGVSPATIHRVLGRDPKYSDTPSMKTVHKIAVKLDAPMPDFSGGDMRTFGGFAEPEIMPILDAPSGETDDKTDPNESIWEVKGNKLVLAGYMPGDRVLADARLDAQDGDTVIVQIYDYDRATAETAIRIYKNHQIVTATPNLDDYEAYDARDRAVVIMAVVKKSWRDRAA